MTALAQYATAYNRRWAANSLNSRIQLQAEVDRLRQEVTIYRDKTRIKDARMARIAPLRRSHNPPTERMAILELRAAPWSLRQTAKTFLVTDATVRPGWNKLTNRAPTDHVFYHIRDSMTASQRH